ncbi:hypothetical protein GCM10011611_37630 [Aliidongia dinghuensis]|uniref:Uncharacterized protein n=1 Tax=Aliidongia dinghuensis TaxID=1867774 RepID=A0A8J2YVG0_9PROT|nr:hypothetical protein [Aliidongia dinghuensis]GGF28089.1 hypothetical protein GCM10011611_37630 [Aliidongia dinghuensis]
MIKRLIVVALFLVLAPAALALEGAWSPYAHPILLKAYHYLMVWQPLVASLLALAAAGIVLEAVQHSTRQSAKATLRAARITARATAAAAERTLAAATAKETARRKARDERERKDQIDIALDALSKLQALIQCLPSAGEESEPQFLVTGPAAFPGLSTLRLYGVEMRIRTLDTGIAKEFAELEAWITAIVGDRETKRDRNEFRKEGAVRRAVAEQLRERIQGRLRFSA